MVLLSVRTDYCWRHKGRKEVISASAFTRVVSESQIAPPTAAFALKPAEQEADQSRRQKADLTLSSGKKTKQNRKLTDEISRSVVVFTLFKAAADTHQGPKSESRRRRE